MFGTINLANYFSKMADLGWAVIPLNTDFAEQLKTQLELKKKLNLFRPAALANTVMETSIRNDLICWLDDKNPSSTESQLLQGLETLRLELKTYFRISLDHFEVHYAVFPKGHYYLKHTDQKENNNHRFFSFVIYLNENWISDDGGRLLIYDQDELVFKMAPQLGQMILFRSDLVHEVEVSHTERQSITGWIRTA